MYRHRMVVFVCRDVARNVSTITIRNVSTIYIINYHNSMNMIGHHHPQWNFCIRIMLCNISELQIRKLPNFSQTHFGFCFHIIRAIPRFTAIDFSEIVNPFFCTNCHKIIAAIVSVPLGSGRGYTIFIHKSLVKHSAVDY